MGKGNNKQRSKKKHEKQKRREVRLRAGLRRPVPARADGGLGGWSPARDGFTGLAHLRNCGFPEAAALAEAAQRVGHPGADQVWTPARVATLSDEDVLARLAALGIVTDRERYLAATAGDTSAFPGAATPWMQALGSRVSGSDQDFTMAAAWDLWRRWRPEKPSREELLRTYHRASVAERSGDFEESLRGYVRFAALLREAFPDARSPAAIDGALGDPRFRFIHFLDSLMETGQTAVGLDDVAAADRVLEQVAPLMDQLTDASPRLLSLIADSRADILVGLGRPEQAQVLLRDAIARWPQHAGPSATLAHTIAGPPTATTADLAEALAVVRGAIAQAEDAGEYDLAELAGILQQRLDERLAVPLS